MPVSNYNLDIYQGKSFALDLSYLNDFGESIDFGEADYFAQMQIRRSPATTKLVLDMSNIGYPNGVTGGGSGGQFGGNSNNEGVQGTGGIVLNYGGETGAMRFEVDYVTMGHVPAGTHFYDVNVLNRDTGEMNKIVTGIVEVRAEVTR